MNQLIRNILVIITWIIMLPIIILAIFYFNIYELNPIYEPKSL